MEVSPKCDGGLRCSIRTGKPLYLFHSECPEAFVRCWIVFRYVEIHHCFVEIPVVLCEVDVSGSHLSDSRKWFAAFGSSPECEFHLFSGFARYGGFERPAI